jgi:hypothetical protein
MVGDTNLDGAVNFGDIVQMLGAGAFGGTQAATWVAGDLNYDGAVDAGDTAALDASGNYSHATLTGGPVGANIGSSGNGIPDFVYNPLTGDVKFKKDGVSIGGSSRISAIQILSAGNKLSASAALSGSYDVNAASGLAGANFNATGFADGFDLGNILPTGLTAQQLAADLTVSYQVLGQGNFAPAEIIVPEPTSLGLIGVSALGLLGRRRRKTFSIVR